MFHAGCVHGICILCLTHESALKEVPIFHLYIAIIETVWFPPPPPLHTHTHTHTQLSNSIWVGGFRLSAPGPFCSF